MRAVFNFVFSRRYETPKIYLQFREKQFFVLIIGIKNLLQPVNTIIMG